MALGRLDGALRHLPASVDRILAARLLRETLISALRQEGHTFSERRFLAWFAGVTTLTDPSDQSATMQRPPRATVVAILTALTHSSWPTLADLSVRMIPAFRAIADENDNEDPDHEIGTPHGDAHALIEEASDLLAALEPSPSPFADLEHSGRAVAGSLTFAPQERAPTLIVRHGLRVPLERPAAPSPRWAIEVQLGERWRAAGLLTLALPLTDLIRLDVLEDDDNDEYGESRVVRARTLEAKARAMLEVIDEARELAGRIAGLMVKLRSTSRVPALVELLTGFGTMRSTQIEVWLGVSRLGARKILDTLNKSGALSRSKLGGVRLFEIMTAQPFTTTVSPEPQLEDAPSSAVREHDATMVDIDDVLERYGIEIPEEDE